MLHRSADRLRRLHAGVQDGNGSEADETFVGGKEAQRDARRSKKLRHGVADTVGKTAVAGIKQRGRESRRCQAGRTDGRHAHLYHSSRENVEPLARPSTPTRPRHTIRAHRRCINAVRARDSQARRGRVRSRRRAHQQHRVGLGCSQARLIMASTTVGVRSICVPTWTAQLGGNSQVDWERRVVYVKATREKGRSRWLRLGNPAPFRTLSRDPTSPGGRRARCRAQLPCTFKAGRDLRGLLLGRYHRYFRRPRCD